MSGGVVDPCDPGYGVAIPLQCRSTQQARAREAMKMSPRAGRIEDEPAGGMSFFADQGPGSIRLSVQLGGFGWAVPGDEQFGDEIVEQPPIREGQGLAEDLPATIRGNLCCIERASDVRYACDGQVALGSGLDDFGQGDLSFSPANQSPEDRLRDMGTPITLDQCSPLCGIVERLPRRLLECAARCADKQANQNEPGCAAHDSAFPASFGSGFSSGGKTAWHASDASGDENVPSGIV